MEAGPQQHIGTGPGPDIFSSFCLLAKDTPNEGSLQKLDLMYQLAMKERTKQRNKSMAFPFKSAK